MGLVKTRRLAAMHKQQKAKAGMKPPVPRNAACTIATCRDARHGVQPSHGRARQQKAPQIEQDGSKMQTSEPAEARP